VELKTTRPWVSVALRVTVGPSVTRGLEGGNGAQDPRLALWVTGWGQGRPALRGLDIVTALGRCHHEVGGLTVSLVPSRTEGGWAPGLGRDAGFPWQPWLARCQGSCANQPGAVTASGPGCEVQIGVLLQELGRLGAAGATGPLSLSVPLCPFLSLSRRWPCCCLRGQEGGHVAEVTLSLAVL
jgi:hypothetical protein